MISRKAAREILNSSELKEGQHSKVYRLACGPKSLRQKLLREQPETDEGKHAAAIEIQRYYRSFRTRCRLLNILQGDVSNVAVYGQSKDALDRLKEVPSPDEKEEKHVAREKLEERYNNYVNKMIASGIGPTSSEIQPFNDFCADEIKRWWQKGREKRSHVSSPPPVGTTQTTTTAAPPTTVPTKKRREEPLGQAEAASIIQKAWRRHIDVQVYRYYRDLINFKSRGDPAMMLRCINPQEAKLLDAAAGIHIKFRLAGDRFPPNIYYKIYTHRPVQDLGANAPRNYTTFDAKRLLAQDVHNKGSRVPQATQEGWYERIENNGWRLVSDRLITHILSDPVTWDTSKKKVEFHHNRIQRKFDVEKKRKQKKIEWMKKMYHEGMLKARVDDEETIGLIEGAAAGMVATIERHGSAAVQDWEVDELLEWTTSLNFEEYTQAWKEVATSANSEKPVYERIHLSNLNQDPYEITLSGGGGLREGSTRQSHNTPTSSHAGSIA